jgi:hypothetical protein
MTAATVTAAEVVAAARGYLGRRTQHQGRIGTFDCVGLVLAVAEDLGLVDVFGCPILRSDYANYSPQPADAFVEQECRRRLLQTLRPVSNLSALRAALAPGEVLTLRVPTIPCHLGIVSTILSEPAVVHAYAGADKVVEHRLDDAWLRRISAVFGFPGVQDG